MNKLLALCGLVFIGNTTTPTIESSISDTNSQTTDIFHCPSQEPIANLVDRKIASLNKELKLVGSIGNSVTPTELNLNEIVFLEAEEVIDLGFDTTDYLPENFDPNKVYFDLNKVTYLDEDKDIDLNFDTADYLPQDFNPYAIPSDVQAISYIEEEIEIDFDTALYLPAGFNPYEVYFNLDSVEYIEDEDEVEFNFNTEDYLPRGFNPYS